MLLHLFYQKFIFLILNRFCVIRWEQDLSHSEFAIFVITFIIFRCYPKPASFLIAKIKVKASNGIHIPHDQSNILSEVQFTSNLKESELHSKLAEPLLINEANI